MYFSQSGTGQLGYDGRMSEYTKTALSWSGLKDAMLYFPYVVPFAAGFDLLVDSLRTKWRGEPIRASRTTAKLSEIIEMELLPPSLRDAGSVERLNAVSRAGIPFVIEIANSSLGEESNSDFDTKQHFVDAISSFFSHYPHLRSIPLIIDSEFISEETNEAACDLAVTIPSLQLIDISATSWDQIIDFRRDNDATEKLRRFRVFAYQNYTDKSRDYIEDDILTRLADYERAVKKWGFATASGTLNTLFNSTLIAGGVAGSFLTAYYKAPLESVISSMSATGLAIANMAVGLGQQRFARKELMANNPVSYISYAKEKLEDK
jgi:hypothetical protein